MNKIRPLHLPTIRRQLCGSDKIPLAFTGRFEQVELKPVVYVLRGEPIDLNYRTGCFDFEVRRSIADEVGPARKSSQHRVFVKCPCCGDFVPAGRLHQHEPACRKHAATPGSEEVA